MWASDGPGRVGHPQYHSGDRSVAVWFDDPHERAGGLWCGHARFPDAGSQTGWSHTEAYKNTDGPPTERRPWTLERRSPTALTRGEKVTWRVWWQAATGRCIEDPATSRKLAVRVGSRPPAPEPWFRGDQLTARGPRAVTLEWRAHRLPDPAPGRSRRAVCVRLSDLGDPEAPVILESLIAPSALLDCTVLAVNPGDRDLTLPFNEAFPPGRAGSPPRPDTPHRLQVLPCADNGDAGCDRWAPWDHAHTVDFTTAPANLPLLYGAAVAFEFDGHETVPSLTQQRVTFTARSHRLRDANGADPGGVLMCVAVVGHAEPTNLPHETVGGETCTPYAVDSTGAALLQSRDQPVTVTLAYTAHSFLEAGRTYPVRVHACLAVSTGGGACEEWDTANPFQAPDLKVPPPPEPPPLFTNIRVKPPTILVTAGGDPQPWWTLTWDSFNRERVAVDGQTQNERFCLRVYGPDPTSAETLAWAPMTLLDTKGDGGDVKTAAHGRVCYSREWRNAPNGGGEQRVRWNGPYLGWPTRRDAVGQPNIDVSMLIPGSWLFEGVRCLSPVPSSDRSSETLKTGHCGKWGTWDDAFSFRWPPERTP